MQKQLAISVLFIALFSLAAYYSFARIDQNIERQFQGSDIEAIWMEGGRMCKGKNPYSRILSGAENAHYKPPTYFPGFYMFACAAQKFFPTEHRLSGIEVWMIVNSCIYLLIGILLFILFSSQEEYLLGLIVAAIFYFTRWHFRSLLSLQIDLAGLVFLVLAFAATQRKMLLGCFFLSLSLLMKQVALIIVPVFVFYGLSRERGQDRFLELAKRAVLVGMIPIAALLPFLIDDFNGVINSIFYSASRGAQGQALYPPALRSMMMFGVFALVYVYAYLGRASVVICSLMIMLNFAGLHRVFFSQYYAWLSITFLMVIYEWISNRKSNPDLSA